MPEIDLDDLARSVLIEVVPTGYRLIDEGDSRFPGIRERFTRLALKHIGPRPALLGFTAPEEDPVEAARAAAVWAAENLRPNAIQKRVTPGVLVIALRPADAPAVAGPVPDAAVRAAVWTVTADGRAETRGGFSGAPSAGRLRGVLRGLLAGREAPTIGQVDVAERTRMHGVGHRSYIFDSPLLSIAGFLCGLFALYSVAGVGLDFQRGYPLRGVLDLVRLIMLIGVTVYAFDIGGARTSLPPLNSSDRRVVLGTALAYIAALAAVSWAAAAIRATPPCTPPSCLLVSQQDNFRSFGLGVGATLEVVVDGAGNCPTMSVPGVLTFDNCVTDNTATPPVTVATFHAGYPGNTDVSAQGFRVTIEVR